jgi:hypothetical protein
LKRDVKATKGHCKSLGKNDFADRQCDFFPLSCDVVNRDSTLIRKSIVSGILLRFQIPWIFPFLDCIFPSLLTRIRPLDSDDGRQT